MADQKADPPRQLPLDLGHGTGYSRDELVVSGTNSQAAALVDRWPDWPSPVVVLAVGVAFVQFWPDWTMIVAVAVVFFIGQFIEGNILQPRLVGKSVGLHPVWLMFSLFAFGALFGFVGLLIAVPASAAVAVLVRFAIARYLESPLYRGHGTAPELPADRRKAIKP